jgi:hypothetical protein
MGFDQARPGKRRKDIKLDQKDDAPGGRLSILQVAQSVLAATIGVQSNRNRERDFHRGSAKAFIIAGLIGTLLFILTVYTVVKLVLHASVGD